MGDSAREFDDGAAGRGSPAPAGDAPCGEARRPGMSRRAFAIGLGSTVALLGLGGFRYAGTTPVVRPPGGGDDGALVSRCVHCYRCVEACPQRVIVPSSVENGILGMRTPRLEFSNNSPGVLDSLRYCDFCAEANGGIPLCARVCPTDALDLPANATFSSTVMGTAEIDGNLCLAYRGAHCTFCHDACVKARGEGEAAISYRDFVKDSDEGALLPVVDAGKCNGCGACEAICVSAQAGSTRDAHTRAITVKPIDA